MFCINTTRDISKLLKNFTRLRGREITYNNFEISLVVFMANITTNHAITYTNFTVLYNISCTAGIFSFFEFFGVGKWFITFYVFTIIKHIKKSSCTKPTRKLLSTIFMVLFYRRRSFVNSIDSPWVCYEGWLLLGFSVFQPLLLELV